MQEDGSSASKDLEERTMMDSIVSQLSEAGVSLPDQDVALVQDFEGLWAKFLEANPELEPTGKKDTTLGILQHQVRDALSNKAAVETELKGQLVFLEDSLANFEEDAQKQLDSENQCKKELHDSLKNQIDTVATTDHILTNMIPWEHFLEAIGAVPAQTGQEDTNSDRLHVLTPKIEDDEIEKLRVERALLSTQAKMLEKEVHRYEKMAETRKNAGQFLTEQNILEVLKSTQMEILKSTGT